MMPFHRFLFSALSLLLIPLAESQTWQGLQADFGAVSYAGGLVLNNNVAYITGQVGAYNCFVGAVSMASDKLQFISKQIVEGAICQTLTLDPHNRLLLLATAEEGGLFTETRRTGSTKATQYGLVAPLQFEGDGSSASLLPGLLMHDDVVQYPKALVLDPNHENFAYVASMHSDSGEENTHTTIDTEPNFTVLRKFGSSYFVMIHRILFDENHNLQKGSWRKEYAVLPENGAEAEVVVSNMLWNNNSLLLVGYSKGSGDAFGTSANDEISGFVTKLDPDTGLIIGDPKRINFGDGNDSFLHDACTSSNDANSIYVTAMTGQTIIIAKLNAATLDIEWQHPLTTDSNANDLTCTVDENNGVVYLAGVVADAGTIQDSVAGQTSSFGKDDVFVAQFDISSGSAKWVKQFGTSKDDRVADIKISPQNGVVLFGDSSGSVMAQASTHGAIWLVHVPFDGSVPLTTEVSNQSNDGGNVAISQPVFGGGSVVPPPSPAPVEVTAPPVSADSLSVALMGLGITTVVVLFIIMVVLIRNRRHREQVTERALVFSYLQAFEPEDIDVRNSATGGWHATYVGKLAHGRSSTSHSSVVKDSLFVDYDLGAPAESMRTPRRKFVIGDDDDDDMVHTPPTLPEEHLRTPYADKGDDDMDAVDIRIGSVGEGRRGAKPWGNEIV
jgi:hypothetical protein